MWCCNLLSVNGNSIAACNCYPTWHASVACMSDWCNIARIASGCSDCEWPRQMRAQSPEYQIPCKHCCASACAWRGQVSVTAALTCLSSYINGTIPHTSFCATWVYWFHRTSEAHFNCYLLRYPKPSKLSSWVYEGSYHICPPEFMKAPIISICPFWKEGFIYVIIFAT